jgi:hypothetical protein
VVVDARVFVLGELSHPSLMFVGKAGSVKVPHSARFRPLEPTQVKRLSGAPLEGRLLALPTNN